MSSSWDSSSSWSRAPNAEANYRDEWSQDQRALGQSWFAATVNQAGNHSQISPRGGKPPAQLEIGLGGWNHGNRLGEHLHKHSPVGGNSIDRLLKFPPNIAATGVNHFGICVKHRTSSCSAAGCQCGYRSGCAPIASITSCAARARPASMRHR